MDPLHVPINPQTSSTSPKELSSKDPVSAQGSKIPDLGEKGKVIFKAAIQKGSDTFEKVKNYFGGTSKLSASKYKEEVLKQLPESSLKEQIKELNSIGDIRKALISDATSEGNSIDAIASFKGKTATAKSDLGRLQNAVERATASASKSMKEVSNSFSETSRVKNQILKRIDQESKIHNSQDLKILRDEVSKATTISAARVAAHKYNLSSLSEINFEGPAPKNPAQYKASVLTQLDNARIFAELNDLETRDYDRLRKIIELSESSADIKETISESNLEGFDPDLVHDNAVSASHYTNVNKLEAAAKNAADRIRNLFNLN